MATIYLNGTYTEKIAKIVEMFNNNRDVHAITFIREYNDEGGNNRTDHTEKIFRVKRQYLSISTNRERIKYFNLIKNTLEEAINDILYKYKTENINKVLLCPKNTTINFRKLLVIVEDIREDVQS